MTERLTPINAYKFIVMQDFIKWVKQQEDIDYEMFKIDGCEEFLSSDYTIALLIAQEYVSTIPTVVEETR